MSAADDRPTPSLTVLVTGGRGFIGSHIVAALLERGHRVRIVTRSATASESDERIEWLPLDLASATRREAFSAALDGVDAIVNCAGILREVGRDRFPILHGDMPAALAEAASLRGIQRFVQISALGNPADGEFVASKHQGDARIAAILPESVILRPSLVYSAKSSYGGTSLLRSLAALPLALLPSGGNQCTQPVAASDLARLVCTAIESQPIRRSKPYDAGGPTTVTLRDYLSAIRHWLGLPPNIAVGIPSWIAEVGATLGEWSGRGPLGLTMWRMLNRGNVCAPDALARLANDFQFRPQSVGAELASQPASSADRWHARLYLLAPLLRVSLALTWMASGLVGLLLDPAAQDAISTAAGMSPALGRSLGLALSVADIVLGIWLLISRRPAQVLALMLAFVIGYTLAITASLPEYWMDPFGGLLKNGVIAVAILFAMSTADRS